MNATKKSPCDAWRANPTVNPRTGRRIDPRVKNGAYAKLVAECGAANAPKSNNAAHAKKSPCDAWRANPTVNPRTGRRIDPRAKNGIYAKLVAECGAAAANAAAVNKRPTNANRARLAAALKTTIGPLLNKGRSLAARLRYDAIVTRYLQRLDPCLRADAKNLYLVRDDGQPAVRFDRRIGSKSVYGIAYLNMGRGFGRLLRFATKIMHDTPANRKEVGLLRRMTDLVRAGAFPNLPIMHADLTCTTKCAANACPELVRGEDRYLVVVSELADRGDLQTWLRARHDPVTYASAIVQMMLAVHAFHGLGHAHRDCHLGNFLVHAVTPGGYWRYRVAGTDVYVPNAGVQVVLWDPGMAVPLSDQHSSDYRNYLMAQDYMRFLGLLTRLHTGDYARDGVVPLPPGVLTAVQGLLRLFDQGASLPAALRVLAAVGGMPGVVFGRAPPPGHLLNVKPFELRALEGSNSGNNAHMNRLYQGIYEWSSSNRTSNWSSSESQGVHSYVAANR